MTSFTGITEFAGKALASTDACFLNVLTPDEALASEHTAARDASVAADGLRHPAPRLRFSRSRSTLRPVIDGVALLDRWRSGSSRGDTG